MRYLNEIHRNALIGTRIELPVHYDAWMMGARYGVITSARHGSNGHSDWLNVKLDSLPTKHRRVKLHKIDWAYARVV